MLRFRPEIAIWSLSEGFCTGSPTAFDPLAWGDWDFFNSLLAGSQPALRATVRGETRYGWRTSQGVCPWNSFAEPTAEAAFLPRHGVDGASLVELMGLS